jgi:hypothetical protein
VGKYFRRKKRVVFGEISIIKDKQELNTAVQRLDAMWNSTK